VGLELVKFARRDDQQGRWADLLVAEATAGEILREQGIPSAQSRIVEAGDFVFLAVRRFDRTDAGGRIGVHSLAAIDGALYGQGGGPWPEVAGRLFEDGLITGPDRSRIQQVWEFGRAIRNTDMHLGNLAFHPVRTGGFQLAPVYDMSPMAYAPTAAGVPEFEAVHVEYPAQDAASWARAFWTRLAGNPQTSPSFRETARRHALV
jgi:hypothetical protein